MKALFDSAKFKIDEKSNILKDALSRVSKFKVDADRLKKSLQNDLTRIISK